MVTTPLREALEMARVNLDAMIRREDFAIQEEEFAMDLIQDFPISLLRQESPILKLLRKPDFQRETNHWSPDQIVTFVASFLDNEVIPSLILWKSPTYIFVIDGGHRLSALRAWMEDDYGDRIISQAFYNGSISDDQKRIAKRTRHLIEQKIGPYSELLKHVDAKGSDPMFRRAKTLVTRGLTLQWIQGSNPAIAETSFYKINSQGTPLDDIERLLIENRKKPIAVGARVILRAGTGHQYWSGFTDDKVKQEIVAVAENLHDMLFEPEVETPLKTLDVPLGGSVSPIDALALLVDFLLIASNRAEQPKTITEYADDDTGDATLSVLVKSRDVLSWITGNKNGSLGLHPAVYFYNERGKYNRFLFLGMVSVVADKLRNNDAEFFKKFTKTRPKVETFLIDNKSLIAIVLQNMGRYQRVPKMRDLFNFLVSEGIDGRDATAEGAIAHLGLRGRIVDVTAIQTSSHITDDTKSALTVKNLIASALKCPICGGLLDPTKSVSYDHKVPVRDKGTGDISNVQMAHPYCNLGKDSLI